MFVKRHKYVILFWATVATVTVVNFSLPKNPQYRMAVEVCQNCDGNFAPTPSRLAWPHAVVKYGVRSVEEVRAAVIADFSVNMHYGRDCQIEIESLHPAVLKVKESLWASYRSGALFKSTLLPREAGETILIDSKGHMIATRCGNCLAREAPPIERRVMPPPPEMIREVPVIEIPEVPVNIPADLSFTPLDTPFPPPLIAEERPVVPVDVAPRGVPLWPAGGAWVPFVPVIASPVRGGITPEPATGWMMIGIGIGFAGMAFYSWLKVR